MQSISHILDIVRDEVMERQEAKGIDARAEHDCMMEIQRKLQNILMLLPEDGEVAKLDKNKKEMIIEQLKELFMEVRGDNRNPKEVHMHDILEAHVDSFFVKENKKKILRQIIDVMVKLDENVGTFGEIREEVNVLLDEVDEGMQQLKVDDDPVIGQAFADDELIKRLLEDIMQRIPGAEDPKLTEEEREQL